jgi:hypothetical protein
MDLSIGMTNNNQKVLKMFIDYTKEPEVGTKGC